jgi:protoheme IX farnesyltransferase
MAHFFSQTLARPADLVVLAKPRITVMVALTSAAGFALASGPRVDLPGLAATVAGTALLAAGASTLNQVVERDVDRLMRRTADRPLPSGRLDPDLALGYGALLSLVGVFLLALAVNALTALIGAATLAGYVFLYTPLKRTSPLATVIGAVPGATPPMMGWTGARNEVELGAWVLFGVLFLWQLPHFLAISWLYRADYERAGMPMLAVLDPEGGQVARQAVLYSAALLPVSLMPSALGLAGGVYAAGAIALGLAFLGTSAAFALARSPETARRLLLVSVLYLPAIFAVLVLDRSGLAR